MSVVDNDRDERRSLRLVEDLPAIPRQADLIANAERIHGHYLRGLNTRSEAYAYAIGVLREVVADYDDDTRHWLDAQIRGLVAALHQTWPGPKDADQ